MFYSHSLAFTHKNKYKYNIIIRESDDGDIDVHSDNDIIKSSRLRKKRKKKKSPFKQRRRSKRVGHGTSNRERGGSRKTVLSGSCSTSTITRKKKGNRKGSRKSKENPGVDSDNTTDNPLPSDVPAINSRPTNDTNKFKSNDGDHSSGLNMFFLWIFGIDLTLYIQI